MESEKEKTIPPTVLLYRLGRVDMIHNPPPELAAARPFATNDPAFHYATIISRQDGFSQSAIFTKSLLLPPFVILFLSQSFSVCIILFSFHIHHFEHPPRRFKRIASSLSFSAHVATRMMKALTKSVKNHQVLKKKPYGFHRSRMGNRPAESS